MSVRVLPKQKMQNQIKIEVERLTEVAKASTFADERKHGEPLFYLPGSDEKPVAMRSATYRAWLMNGYEKHYGALPARRSVRTFITFAYYHSYVSIESVSLLKSLKN